MVIRYNFHKNELKKFLKCLRMAALSGCQASFSGIDIQFTFPGSEPKNILRL